MQIFSLFFASIRLTLKHWRFVTTWGVTYAVLLNGVGYAFDYLPIDYFDTLFGDSLVLPLLFIISVFCVLLLAFLLCIAPIEILWFRCALQDHTDLFGFASMSTSIWRYLGMSVLVSVLLMTTMVLAYFALGFIRPDPFLIEDAIAQNEGFSLTYIFRVWRFDQSHMLVGLWVQAAVSLPLVAIALGHTVRFGSVFKWHMRRFHHTAFALFLYDTFFFVIFDRIDTLFGYQDALPINLPHFITETAVAGIQGILFLAVLSLIYREYVKQTFENTKAASRAASVFE